MMQQIRNFVIPSTFATRTRAALGRLLPLMLIVAFFSASCGGHKPGKGPAPRERADIAGYYDARHDIPPSQWKYKESKPYKIGGTTYYPLADAEDYEEKGTASWYGPDFHNKSTASGETYHQDAMTAAHRTLPFNTLVLVENLDNGRSVVVRINDRGPYAKDRIIDLSKRAAKELAMTGAGTARVQLSVKYAVKRSGADTVDAPVREANGENTSLGDDGNDPGRGFLPLGKKRGSNDAPAPKKERRYSGKMMHD